MCLSVCLSICYSKGVSNYEAIFWSYQTSEFSTALLYLFGILHLPMHAYNFEQPIRSRRKLAQHKIYAKIFIGSARQCSVQLDDFEHSLYRNFIQMLEPRQGLKNLKSRTIPNFLHPLFRKRPPGGHPRPRQRPQRRRPLHF